MQITVAAMRSALVQFTGQPLGSKVGDDAVRSAHAVYVNTFSVRRVLSALGA